MRVFVGVPLSAEVRDAALEMIDRLRRDVARLAPSSRISWTSADRLHVTVRFIGHVDDTAAATVAGVLAPPLRMRPFDVTVAGLGTFPPKGPPRVVWAGIDEGADTLDAVERLVSDRLMSAGIGREDRAYRPHVTLARVREAGGLRTMPVVGSLGDWACGTMRVDAITLFESRLSPKGALYVPLQRTSLLG